MTQAARKTLDIGCGTDKLPASIGIDANPSSDADIIHDLDVRPWPIKDNEFDYIRAQDILEHVRDFFGVMEEVYRVAKPGAIVEVRMPFMSSRHFATDPTHVRAGTSSTFDYFDPSTVLGRYRYSKARFSLLEFHYSRGYVGKTGKFWRTLDRVAIPFLERHTVEYELYFAYLYPMLDVSYRLRVDKPNG